MGKRSNFERRERDFYPTPLEAVLPLLPHLAPGASFVEPCAGDGALVRHLEGAGHHCAWASDIAPQSAAVKYSDATNLNIGDDECVITNPPWDRSILHPMILHFARQCPTWLLFDADWIHTKQAAPFLPMLHRVVSVGRVKWIPDSKMTGKDNCAWHLFDAASPAKSADFFGRTNPPPVGQPASSS